MQHIIYEVTKAEKVNRSKKTMHKTYQWDVQFGVHASKRLYSD